MDSKLLLLNKPFNVLSQFTDNGPGAADHERETLKRYIQATDCYPAGRLDRDSEGLLLLTNNGQWQAKISSPRFKMPKTYWAQVEGMPNNNALQQLRHGVTLKDGPTLPAEAELMEEPSGLWHRDPPIRERASIPTCWIALTIHEGRNRQVRRMTAAIGHPTLRLIRYSIGDWTLDGLQPGECRQLMLPALPGKQTNKPRPQQPTARRVSSSRSQPPHQGRRKQTRRVQK